MRVDRALVFVPLLALGCGDLIGSRPPSGTDEAGRDTDVEPGKGWRCRDGALTLTTADTATRWCGGAREDVEVDGGTLAFGLRCTSEGFRLTRDGEPVLDCTVDGWDFDCTLRRGASLPPGFALEGSFSGPNKAEGTVSFDDGGPGCLTEQGFDARLVVGGTPGGDTGEDTGGGGVDTDPVTDTDTGGPVDAFQPTMFDYLLEFAVGTNGLPKAIGTGGNTLGPIFSIAMEDDQGDRCTVYYLLDDDQYAYAGQTGGNAAVKTWLTTSGARFGYRIAPGGYTAMVSTDPSERCADLHVGWLNQLSGTTYADVPTAALQLGGTGTMLLGLNVSPTASALSAVSGTGIDPDEVLGAVHTFPFEVGGTDTLDGLGIWAHLAAATNLPEDDGAGTLVLQPRSGAWVGTPKKPAAGYYRAFGAGLIVSP